jgi:hypothetical protein
MNVFGEESDDGLILGAPANGDSAGMYPMMMA